MSKKRKKLSSFILLDRSGSMAPRWSDTIGGVQEYVKKLKANDHVDTDLTLMTFDTESMDIILEMTPLGEVKKTILDDVRPRGGTPLYDAIAKIAAKITVPHDAALVIVTDGEENSSKTTSADHVRGLIEGLKTRGVHVTYLGCHEEAFKTAKTIGVAINQTINFDPTRMVQTFSAAASNTMRYSSLGGSNAYGGGLGSSAVGSSYSLEELQSAGDDSLKRKTFVGQP